jgi:integrase
MSVDHPTAPSKPAKPNAAFPLFAHATGRWAKKIRGKFVYFGPWADPDGALDSYLRQKDDLHAGKTPKVDTRELKVWHLASHFRTTKQALVDNGELSPRTWDEYKAAGDLIVSCFGKHRLVSDLAPDDFARLRNRMAKKWGPHRLAKMIQYIRSVFKHGFDASLMDRPMRFGPGFNRPSKKTFRIHKAEQGPKLFTADEIKRLIDAAGPTIRAMVLLGINAGFGNADCGALPLSALDLDGGWVTFPRPKTGVNRRCSLWPETVSAIRDAMAKRPKPKRKEHAGNVFITKRGGCWARDDDPGVISKEMAKLLKEVGISGRTGVGFYTLRHTFRTVADESRDQPATDFVMGHESTHMSGHYRETISDERLKAVVDYVRAWLFAKPAAAALDTPKGPRLRVG